MRMTRFLAVPFAPLIAVVLAAAPVDFSTSHAASPQALECTLIGATMDQALARPSPLRTVEFTYDGGEGLLCHGAPSARGRQIMGGLVPWGQPWRMGANEPTTIHLSAPASIGDVAVQAGSYSIYAIPNEGEWRIFVNSNFQRWGIPIDAAVRSTEIGSFEVTPTATGDFVEMLTYSYEDGNIVMEWENTRLSFPVG
jgi:Protein of unknown function (DUF2911)